MKRLKPNAKIAADYTEVEDSPEESIGETLTVSTVLDAAWRNILETNIPSETHPLQVKTYKRFFYAGAKALMDTLVYSDTLDDGQDDATPQDVKRIDAIMHEITQFFAEVIAGRQ